jgi:hypothetical protein
MKTALVCALMLLGFHASEASERVLPMDDLVMGDIKVEGLVQAWKLRKLCVDGQAYLLILGANQEAPISITASFKDGKPEQCKLR